ncbi:MAG: hypothetical protein ACTS8S_17805, partial [Giesbergeria sp.]
YNGTRITGDTEVTRFMLAASFVYISVKSPSRYYIAGRDNIGFAKTMYTLASLLIGWRGIPWGPIYTIQAIEKNISGGERTTIRAYFSL